MQGMKRIVTIIAAIAAVHFGIVVFARVQLDNWQCGVSQWQAAADTGWILSQPLESVLYLTLPENAWDQWWQWTGGMPVIWIWPFWILNSLLWGGVIYVSWYGLTHRLPVKRNLRLTILSVWFTLPVLVVLILYRDLIIRTVKIPWRVHSSWVEDSVDEQVVAHNEQMFKIYRVYRAGRCKYGIKWGFNQKCGFRTFHSRFEDAGRGWILVEDGKVTNGDYGYFENPHGDHPDFYEHELAVEGIGYYRDFMLGTHRAIDKSAWVEDERGTAISNQYYFLKFAPIRGL